MARSKNMHPTASTGIPWGSLIGNVKYASTNPEQHITQDQEQEENLSTKPFRIVVSNGVDFSSGLNDAAASTWVSSFSHDAKKTDDESKINWSFGNEKPKSRARTLSQKAERTLSNEVETLKNANVQLSRHNAQLKQQLTTYLADKTELKQQLLERAAECTALATQNREVQDKLKLSLQLNHHTHDDIAAPVTAAPDEAKKQSATPTADEALSKKQSANTTSTTAATNATSGTTSEPQPTVATEDNVSTKPSQERAAAPSPAENHYHRISIKVDLK